jgi:tetratricopeptide (TPR) repeat protein
MSKPHIFISHSSKDDGLVKELRAALETYGLSVWVDSRNLSGGAKLAPEIEKAIEEARQFIVVISTNTVNSPWVLKEVQKALEVEETRKPEGYRVIPLLLPGIEPSALSLWFKEEPVGVRVRIEAGGLSEALPQIISALGERPPDDAQPAPVAITHPVEELILKLSEPRIETREGRRRAKAKAQLIYHPADYTAREVESGAYYFTAPLGPIETDDLRWYLEQFYLWPTGVFIERAQVIEGKLPQWGQELFQAASSTEQAKEALNSWLQTADDAERRFSIEVDGDVIEDPSRTDEEKQTAQVEANEAAGELLSLPWELLHDGRGFLFHGRNPVRVRRRLPNRYPQKPSVTGLPLRILLVSPRPEEEGVGYIDHRISARPLIEAIERLGELATLTVLNPPTFPALQQTLQKASEAGQRFDVVHFDGHGVYDRRVGLGGLCFEDPKDSEKPEDRAMQLIHAEELAQVIRAHRIPLVFLEACQSAKIEDNPTASVAARLLQEGVTSVVAMSHIVLVETARRFVASFYEALAEGRRVGTAMLAGQRALYGDTLRGKVMGAGDLRLQDWFVPVLYQEENDPLLVAHQLSKEAQQVQQKPRERSFGALPKEPPHSFIGRSRELLALERLLQDDKLHYAVVRGQGGAGKTTLGAELARWLVRTHRFEQAAFVSLETYTDARNVLISLGQQLLPDGDKWHVGLDEDIQQALQPVERALRDRSTIILLDNMESVLPDATGQATAETDLIKELFSLCQSLLQADSRTRLLFTTREPLPEPFNHRHRQVPLSALSRADAVELVSEVMKREGLTPKADDPGGDPQEITDLVEAVNRHARALVLLAREVARSGVRSTTENLNQLMAELDRKYPGERENSLYASVELSLRRLPLETRERIKVLAVFHGGAHLQVINYTLGMAEDDVKTVKIFAAQLVEAGLAEALPYGHLRLDPALSPYLLREMSENEQEEVRARWAKGMSLLVALLYEQKFEDAEFSHQLTLLELPNLLAMLNWAQDRATPELVVSLAQSIEGLLSRLGTPRALAQATRVRESAAKRLKDWSHARVLTESANIDRLIERGDLQAAYAAAQQLLKRCLAAKEDAYPEAAHDAALAYFRIGRILKMNGSADAALPILAEANMRFQALEDTQGIAAERMVATTITDKGDCLADLGRWDEAVAAYEEAIIRAEKLDDKRKIAVNKCQLASVRVSQQRYDDALEIYAEARSIFEKLGEPGSVSTIWHQIGIAHREARQFEQAERAYLQSLAIEVQQKNPAGEAGSLTELGNLYRMMGRLEEAVKCYRQAINIFVKQKDILNEGKNHGNIGSIFISLQRYDEAREELYLSLECFKPYGYVAEPWRAWSLLHMIEEAGGNKQAAAQTRQQAIDSYLAYRLDGGQSMSLGAQLCVMAAGVIERGDTTEMEQILAEFSGEGTQPAARALLSKLQAILRGERDSALADDPNLEYDDVVELRLLLEALKAK